MRTENPRALILKIGVVLISIGQHDRIGICHIDQIDQSLDTLSTAHTAVGEMPEGLHLIAGLLDRPAVIIEHVRDELLHPAGTGSAKLLIHHERAVESEGIHADRADKQPSGPLAILLQRT